MAKKSSTFNERYLELEKLVAWFEKDDFDLETGLEKYQAGVNLVKELKKELTVLENTIKDIKLENK